MKNTLRLRNVLFASVAVCGLITAFTLSSFSDGSNTATTAEVLIESVVSGADFDKMEGKFSVEDCIEWCKANPNCTPEECKAACEKYCGSNCCGDDKAEPTGDCCSSACDKKS